MNTKTLIYFAALILNIIAGVANIPVLSFATKPLLMLILIWMVLMEKIPRGLKIPLIIALFFSWGGDMFLLFERTGLFVFGLSSFLLAHLVYIYIYQKKAKLSFLNAFPFLGFVGLFCFGVLLGKLSAELTIPVYVYMLVISIMGFMASNRVVNKSSFENVLIGACLFIISDAFIAINEFVQDVPLASFWVMSTYGIAQFMIVKGLIKQDLKGQIDTQETIL
jgi:uncharacterized membrane protein YhhN